MRLKPEQLAASLQKTLAPVYFISGDEPLQIIEATDAIRNAAKKSGFANREILSAETGFDWKQLALTAAEQSIFADKKIIELRLSGTGPGTEGAKALVSYCAHLPDDTVLMISCGKLASTSLKSRWFQALDNIGVVMQVWPLEGQFLLSWLQQRLQVRGLQVDRGSIKLIASRVEGNLLAAVQEIEKLYVLHGIGNLSYQQVSDAVADSSRYDVFALVSAVLEADVSRLFKIITSLKAEGIAAPIVLWALAREARSLIKIKWQLSQGQSRDVVFRNNQIWDKRQALVSAALNRLSFSDLNAIIVLSASADREIKGQQAGDAWATLRAICLLFASVKLL
ncbi:DNA polymerase III, delta subunit [Crenothrix polyspora]|uniref:DNA polymerase III subunit delta n=1 Tax=Crenothrix polyspora TaxID=360316 RepID=A0A1R4HIA1_9GAMM|nr:DNA polymerase III subunit delta [Crenothrix polyspora]SJM95966.1 DNA polymerase III, delta subunit [Crenothrix polyspora]